MTNRESPTPMESPGGSRVSSLSHGFPPLKFSPQTNTTMVDGGQSVLVLGVNRLPSSRFDELLKVAQGPLGVKV